MTLDEEMDGWTYDDVLKEWYFPFLRYRYKDGSRATSRAIVGIDGTRMEDGHERGKEYESYAVIPGRYKHAMRCFMKAEQPTVRRTGGGPVSTAEGAALWEFVSAAYVMHALKGRVQITSFQRAALQNVLARVPSMGKPPTSRRDIDTALYVWARTLAAKDSGTALVAVDGLEQFAPAVHRTLIRRSGRWGDADDN